MSKHKGAPWIVIKNNLEDDFSDWCEVVHAEETAKDVIEFLFQKGFIKGKRWKEYIDSLEYPFLWWNETENMAPMREGYIPPKAWIK